jgi:hypothetical protein
MEAEQRIAELQARRVEREEELIVLQSRANVNGKLVDWKILPLRRWYLKLRVCEAQFWPLRKSPTSNEAEILCSEEIGEIDIWTDDNERNVP